MTRSTVMDVKKSYVLDDGMAVLDQDQLEDAAEGFGSDVEEVHAQLADSSWPVVPSSAAQNLETAIAKGQAVGGDDEESDAGDEPSDSGSDGSDDDDSGSDSGTESGDVDMAAKQKKLQQKEATKQQQRRLSGASGTKRTASVAPTAGGKKGRTSAGSAASKPAEDDDEEEGDADPEADGLINNVKGILDKFTSGEMSKFMGRENQIIIREIKENTIRGNACYKRILVSKHKAARKQGHVLRDLLMKMEAVGNFQKVFNKGSSSGSGPFSVLESLWDKMVAVGVCPPATVEAEMCSKKIDEYLSNENVTDALKLISIVPVESVDGEGAGSSGKVWTLAAIADKSVQAETCSVAGVKVFGKVFAYRVKHKTEEEAANAVPEFMAKVQGITLPPDIALQLKTISAVTDWKFKGIVSEDSRPKAEGDSRCRQGV